METKGLRSLMGRSPFFPFLPFFPSSGDTVPSRQFFPGTNRLMKTPGLKAPGFEPGSNDVYNIWPASVASLRG